MIGIYLEEDFDKILPVLYGKWYPLTKTCIAYINIWSLDGSKTQADFTNYINHAIDKIYFQKPKDMKVIIGFQTSSAEIATNWQGFFGLERWMMFKDFAKFIQKKTRNREVVMVHESSATNEFYCGKKPLNWKECEIAYEQIKAMNVWHDLPVVNGFEPAKPWIENMYKVQPPNGPHWKWLAGTNMDHSGDPDGHQWKDFAFHVGVVGKSGYVHRCFTSSNGLYAGSGFRCFEPKIEAEDKFSLPRFLTKRHSNPVTLYTGHEEFEKVADQMSTWYV